MSFEKQLKDRLETYLGQPLDKVKEELESNPYHEVIDTYKALETFKSSHPSLSREMIEDVVGINKGKIHVSLRDYNRNYRGK
jgi:hypothetical protein